VPERPFSDFAGLTTSERSELRSIVDAHGSLDQIFAWGRGQSPRIVPADVIKQDEFTHDVLVPFPRGRWVVYGTT